MAYPTGIQIFLDDEDITYYLFGSRTLDTSIDNYIFRDIDLTQYMDVPGIHTLKITTADAGRAEVRVEIF